MREPHRPLRQLIEKHRVIIVVGSGGVGKTTTAAAIAVQGAKAGRQVLCLTIDPAKRLATSLGLRELKSEEQVIAPSLFEAHGIQLKGSLTAMMLDAKATADALVRASASSPEQAERILSNRIYQYMSTSLAGMQEYMAVEKLYAVQSDPRFDLIVLDTPPTSNALDFLDAPERISGIIDSPVVQWLTSFFRKDSRKSRNLVGRGARLVLQAISRFTGKGFLEDVAGFLAEFNDIFGGFRKHAMEVGSALRSPGVAFIVVASPAEMAIDEAIFFAERLLENQMPCEAFVVNQVHRVLPSLASQKQLAEELMRFANVANPDFLIERMLEAHRTAAIQAEADRKQIDRLRHRFGNRVPIIEVPAFERDVHDLQALDHVGRALIGEFEGTYPSLAPALSPQ
ncbi:MAG: AAA family ATPase [Sandaracinaceae bacterium]|nr:AAA family ATPase [Sandaracinaceae bacterium]